MGQLSYMRSVVDRNVVMRSMTVSSKCHNTVRVRRVQPTRCDVSQFIYFCKTLHMFQTGFSAHHQELKTAHTASGICQTDTATCC